MRTIDGDHYLFDDSEEPHQMMNLADTPEAEVNPDRAASRPWWSRVLSTASSDAYDSGGSGGGSGSTSDGAAGSW